MKNAWIVPVVVIALALITGGIVSLIPEKEILVEEIVHADTIVINSAEYSSAPEYFSYIVKKYKINVNWSKNIKDLHNNEEYFIKEAIYGDLEDGEYSNAIFLFNPVTWLNSSIYIDTKEQIELGAYKANYCKENNIRAIGINLLSRNNGVPNTKMHDEKYTYDVINTIAPYMDILIIYNSENIDNRYYDLAEKNGVELIIVNSTDELAEYLKTLGI